MKPEGAKLFEPSKTVSKEFFDHLVSSHMLGHDGFHGKDHWLRFLHKGDQQRAHHTTDRGTFVPLVFAPGEAFQFDWSEDWVYVGGERIKLWVAHIKLPHTSNAPASVLPIMAIASMCVKFAGRFSRIDRYAR